MRSKPIPIALRRPSVRGARSLACLLLLPFLATLAHAQQDQTPTPPQQQTPATTPTADELQREIDSLQRQLDALRKPKPPASTPTPAPTRPTLVNGPPPPNQDIEPSQTPNTVGPGNAYTLQVNARLVSVDATVRDSHGRLLPSLNKADFQIRADGQLQTIRYFDPDNNLPLTLGLLVDTSSSTSSHRAEEISAASVFLTSMLTHPQDSALLERFDSHILLLADMTTSAGTLRQSLHYLNLRQQPHDSHHGTLLWDAIAVTLRKDIPYDHDARRALIVLTDGEDNGSQTLENDAIELAQIDNVAIYTLLFPSSDEPDYIANSNHSAYALAQKMTLETGGQLFPVSNGKSIAQAFGEIQKTLRSQYRIGFTPPPSAPGKFHTLKLVVKGGKVQSRSGYYSPFHSTATNGHIE